MDSVGRHYPAISAELVDRSSHAAFHAKRTLLEPRDVLVLCEEGNVVGPALPPQLLRVPSSRLWLRLEDDLPTVTVGNTDRCALS